MYDLTQLENMTVRSLKEIASSLGVVGYSKKPKFEIIDMIDEIQGSVITRENLETKTADELKYIAVEMGIRGMSKARKADVVNAILSTGGASDEVNAVSGTFDIQTSDGSDTQLKVSCGASSGRFPIVGKQVGAVAELLTEVLNISEDTEPVVNGAQVESTYLMKDGDTLEFTKRAGTKG